MANRSQDPCWPSGTRSRSSRHLSRYGLTAVAVFAAPLLCNAQGIISTVAGNGTAGFSGDGGPATSASLHSPCGVVLDAAGNVYFTDYFNYRIRKITTGGVISTVAGNGTAAFSGDGGPATSASLNGPDGLALDAAGNLYFSDDVNERIRKVSTAGIISTVAGSGATGFSGDGGPAISASLHSPAGVAVDTAGNLYFADIENNRIRKVAPSGIISTVAGNGTGGFSGDGGPATGASLDHPEGVAVDAVGNVYVADSEGCRIRKVNTSGIITTAAGNGVFGYGGDGGPATSAQVGFPVGVALDNAGNMFIAESDPACVIRKVTTDGIISTIAGNGVCGFSGDGPATSVEVGAYGLAADGSGELFFAHQGANRIRKVSAALVPSINSGGVVNGASFVAPVAAGSIASVFGTNLASSTASATSNPLQNVLAGTSAAFTRYGTPLFFVSSGQLNIQVPWELAGQTQTSLTVTAAGQTSAPQTVSLATYAPGVLQLPSGQGIIVISNTAIYAAPAGSIPNAQSRPVNPGEYLTIYATGLGPVTNQPPTGYAALATPLSVTPTNPIVTIGDVPAAVVFSGLSPGFVGLYQVNAQVPQNAPAGNAVPTVLNMAGAASKVVTIAIGSSVIQSGARVMAAASAGVVVRNTQLAELFTQLNGVHGTVIAGPMLGTAGGFTGNWWEINWDAEPPNQNGQPGWSAESVIALAPLAGDVPRPDFSNRYYSSNENIFWASGFAPSATNPPNGQLGTALGNCTWYAYGRMLELGANSGTLSVLHGNAALWATQASGTFRVDSTPTVHSIAQRNSSPGQFSLGHVAIVESVNTDGTVTVTESSDSTDPTSFWDFEWRHRSVSPTWFDNFIHVF